MTMQSQGRNGYKLQQLTKHIKSVLGEQLESCMESWMEELSLELTPKNNGLGMDIGVMTYQAVFSFERFPFKQQDPALVMASVMAWLQDNDPERERFELAPPAVDVEPESDSEVIMTIEVPFREAISVVKDENGPLLWKGKRYKLADYEIWLAKKETVFTR